MRRAPTAEEPRRGAKWVARREAIIDTSAHVFARGGYHATGIAELCEANDLGKGALYHYIGSKEELLAAIHDRVMDEVMAGADRVAADGGPPALQLAQLGAELLEVIHRYPDHVWVFLHEFPALTGERAQRFRKRRRAYERRVEDVLTAGVAEGAFRSLDARLTAMAWLGMHNYTYLWLKASGRLSARDVASPFAELFLNGITASNGSAAAKGVAKTVAKGVTKTAAAGPAGTDGQRVRHRSGAPAARRRGASPQGAE